MKNLPCCAFTVFLFFLLHLFALSSHGAIPIPCNGNLSGEITKPGEVDEYSFEAEAGDKIVIRSFSTDIALDAGILLFQTKDGRPVSPDLVVIHLSGMIHIEHVSKEGGAMLIRYLDKSGLKTGRYDLALRFLKPSCADFWNRAGAIAPNLAHPAAMEALSFSAGATEKVSLRVKSVPGFHQTLIELYDPAGRLAGSYKGGSEAGDIPVEISAPASGVYLILIMGQPEITSGGEMQRRYSPLDRKETGIRSSLSVFPNPVRETANFCFDLASPQTVHLEVYDGNGRKLQTLINGALDAGMHTCIWDPSGLPSGVYAGRLVLGGEVFSKILHFFP